MLAVINLSGHIMQDVLNSKSNDEIDLRDLFITLWAYKLLIASTCVLGITFSGYYALYSNKKFTSEAIFKLGQKKTGSIGINEDLSALANLAGYNVPNTSNLPVDQIMGRIFIEKLNKKLDFKADPYFNTYNPNSVDPIWKSVIKHVIGWQKSSIDTKEAIWQGIV